MDKENLYDKDFVKNRTVGFDKWKDYILGKEDKVEKTPEWAAKETGLSAKILELWQGNGETEKYI